METLPAATANLARLISGITKILRDGSSRDNQTFGTCGNNSCREIYCSSDRSSPMSVLVVNPNGRTHSHPVSHFNE